MIDSIRCQVEEPLALDVSRMQVQRSREPIDVGELELEEEGHEGEVFVDTIYGQLWIEGLGQAGRQLCVPAVDSGLQ